MRRLLVGAFGAWLGGAVLVGCGSDPNEPSKAPQHQPHAPQGHPNAPQYGQPGYPPPPPADGNTTPPQHGAGDSGDVAPNEMDPVVPKAREDRRFQNVDDARTAMAESERELDKLLEGAVGLSGGDRCTRLCKALGSMRRAVNSVCELAGDEDERCVTARSRLENSERRVTDAGCTC